MAVVAIIVITVAVAVVGSVEHQRHVVQLLFLVDLFDVGQLAAVQFAGTRHEYRKVGYAVGYRSVGYDAYRHTVYHDIVVSLAQFGYQLVQPLVHQQFCRIGGDIAGGYDVKLLLMLDDIVGSKACVCQVIGHAPLLQAVDMAQRTPTDVEVDKDDPLLGLHEAHGKVARYEGLPGSFVERSEGNDLHGPTVARHKLHIGAQDAERLCHDVALAPVYGGHPAGLAFLSAFTV